LEVIFLSDNLQLPLVAMAIIVTMVIMVAMVMVVMLVMVVVVNMVVIVVRTGRDGTGQN